MPVNWEEYDIDKDQGDKEGPGIAEMEQVLNNPNNEIISINTFQYGKNKVYIKCLIFWREKE